MKTEVRTRMSADERREEILDAAMAEFAHKGLHGTSTEVIARRVGISQPYLFRLYGTKKELFLAAVDRGFQWIERLFSEAARNAQDGEVLKAMGHAYGELLSDRERLQLQLQSYAACADPDIRALVSRRYADLYHLVERLSGAGPREVQEFFAAGMLLNVVAAMDLPALLEDDDWLYRCLQ